MVQLCEYFSEHFNESDCLNMYSSTMANTLHAVYACDMSLGELQVFCARWFCAFSATYCICLHKHNVDKDAVKEKVYMSIEDISSSLQMVVVL